MGPFQSTSWMKSSASRYIEALTPLVKSGATPGSITTVSRLGSLK